MPNKNTTIVRQKTSTSSKAVVTIVSRNYMAAARVLANSFKLFNKDVKFYVYICDSVDGIDAAEEPFEVLSLSDVSIPGASYFFSSYTVMEANTAVKPFVLKYLFEEKKHSKVCYIDPDIQFFDAMTEVWSQLEEHSIVLTPHINQPYGDNKNPSELQILQSGTYNLGFVGLANTPESHSFLDWWQEKLYRDCIVDIPRGLFVDQKWVDLIPGYFKNVYILHAPTYNVAYWNLHERSVVLSNGKPFIDDAPIVFFHFSGYSPFFPDRLSKHQNRHELDDLPAVNTLCRNYGSLLLKAGHVKQSQIPYAYGKLPNGVSVTYPIQAAVRRSLQNGRLPPDPWTDSDGFAIWLMTACEPYGSVVMTPLQIGILEVRSDVAKAFPNVFNDPKCGEFWHWVSGSGVTEMDLRSVLAVQPYPVIKTDLVEETFQNISERYDVFKAFDNFWFDKDKFAKFCEWVKNRGTLECDLTPAHSEALLAARDGMFRLLKLYVITDELQLHFKNLTEDSCLKDYCHWLRTNASTFNIKIEEISLLYWFVKRNTAYVDHFMTLYKTADKKTQQISFNAWLALVNVKTKSAYFSKNTLDWLMDGGISAADQLHELLRDTTEGKGDVDVDQDLVNVVIERTLKPISSRLSDSEARKLYLLKEKALSSQNTRQVSIVNVAGYVDSPTGMGASGRSMVATIEASRWNPRVLTVPTVYDEGLPQLSKTPLGWPSSSADLSILVANADVIKDTVGFLPTSFRAKHNIGYWVWETDDFPKKFVRSATYFTEIWTPSLHSANAIKKVVDLPVHVLPHVLDFQKIDDAIQNRSAFDIPDDVTAFGFIFDGKSYIYRKNPQAVVRAFREAFGDRNDVLLILKINGANDPGLDYQRFKSSIKDHLNIRLIEATWSYEKTLSFMKSIDVYVSLHRAEGFGLTCAEAMALGKPVIATAYSGNVDFMDDKSACLVRGTLQQSHRPHGPYAKGTTWYEPDTHEAAEYMIKLINRDHRQNVGRQASKYIRSKLDRSVVASQFEKLVDNLLKNS